MEGGSIDHQWQGSTTSGGSVTLLTRIESVIKLWQLVLPHIETPPGAWIARISTHPDEAIEAGIIRCSKKFSPDRLPCVFDPSNAWKYTSAVIIAEASKYHSAPEECITEIGENLNEQSLRNHAE